MKGIVSSLRSDIGTHVSRYYCERDVDEGGVKREGHTRFPRQ